MHERQLDASNKKKPFGLWWLILLLFLLAGGFELAAYLWFVASALATVVAAVLVVGTEERPWKRELPFLVSRRRMLVLVALSSASVLAHGLALWYKGFQVGLAVVVLVGNASVCAIALVGIHRARKHELEKYGKLGYRTREAIESCRQRAFELSRRISRLSLLERRIEDLVNRAARSEAHQPRVHQLKKAQEYLRTQRQAVESLRERYLKLAEDLQIELDAQSLGPQLEEASTDARSAHEEFALLEEQHEKMVETRRIEAELEKELGVTWL